MSLKDKLLNDRETSLYGLGGEKGPEFENQGMMFTSAIQAKTAISRDLQASEDLLSGRNSRQIPFLPYYQSETVHSLKGQLPSTGTYKNNGPTEGRY